MSTIGDKIELFYNLTSGSQADWMMVFVTLIGTIIIAGTFRNQLSLNRKQAIINDLLTEKERREIRPYFRVKDYRIGFGGFVNLELEQARAMRLRIMPAYDGKYIVTTSKLIKLFVEPGFKITLQFKESADEDNITRESKIATIFSQDELQTSCYRQEVWVEHNEPYITPPVRVKEYDLVPILGAKKIKSINE